MERGSCLNLLIAGALDSWYLWFIENTQFICVQSLLLVGKTVPEERKSQAWFSWRQIHFETGDNVTQASAPFASPKVGQGQAKMYFFHQCTAWVHGYCWRFRVVIWRENAKNFDDKEQLMVGSIDEKELLWSASRNNSAWKNHNRYAIVCSSDDVFQIDFKFYDDKFFIFFFIEISMCFSDEENVERSTNRCVWITRFFELSKI